MMSLVAYGSSDDDSEAEDEGSTNVQASDSKPSDSIEADEQTKETQPSLDDSKQASKTVSNGSLEEDSKQGNNANSNSSAYEQQESSGSKELFSKLPAPIPMTDFISSASIVSRKKSQPKGPVKILVPSLPEFDEEDEPPAKKKAQAQVHKSTSGTKLMSMLPAPKGGTFTKETKPSLVPQSITRKPVPPVKPKPPIKKVTPAAPPKPKSLTSYDDSGDESGGEGASSDFFSLSANRSVPSDFIIGVPAQQNVYCEPATSSTEVEQQAIYPGYAEYADVADSSSSYAEPQADSGQDYIGCGSNDLQLDDEAIQKLCGRKGRREENVQIIDVSGDEIMPDSKEWLTKQLTQERPNRSHRKGFGPSSQQRRKHQITYLAFQAKENELELQNQWADNRQSRRQTQSKYGF